jgi:hypothetical protein
MRRIQLPWLARAVATFAAVAVLACSQPPAEAQKPGGTRIKGHVVRVQGTDGFVVRTADKREVILHTHPKTKFLINEREARFADLREGVEIDALIEEEKERSLANSVTIIPAAEAAEAAEEVVEGTVVRVNEANNEIVIRTAEKKEVVVLAEERTKFTIEDRAVKLTEFRPGMAVRANFVVKDKKNMARSVTVQKSRR